MAPDRSSDQSATGADGRGSQPADNTRTGSGRTRSTTGPRGPQSSEPRTEPALKTRAWSALTSDSGWVAFVREVLVSVLAVLLIGAVLFFISGVWPPLVAVESGSMEPHMHRGDLVFLMDQGRFVPEAAYGDTGIVTYRDGRDVGYTQFGSYGDVIVFTSSATPRTAIIHRARFWVDQGENWYPKAEDEFLPSGARNCHTLSNCPAPNPGFVTKGDANPSYDQAIGISPPVQPDWIRGTAEIKVPWLGHVRLFLSELQSVTVYSVDSNGAIG